ncbi:MAG: hypothetical protein EA424_10480 [Planctomycetaceae bacterium]|nr:MAG: hypothetical protein EA424_10480 [Planctomycetaceae bacterium]
MAFAFQRDRSTIAADNDGLSGKILAAVTFLVGMVVGMQRFGFTGFFTNQVPSMSLPLVMANLIKPLLLILELVGI